MMEVRDSVAIVTGGGSCLGKACVSDLVKNGTKVSIFDLSIDKSEKMLSELGELAVFCKTDVCDNRSVQNAIKKTIDHFGNIHVVVNCAEVAASSKVLTKKGPISMKHFCRVVEINLMGTINVIRLAAKKMLENERNESEEKGVIINTASIAAFEGQVGQVAYSASKAAIIGMTLPMAREFAEYGIRVMTISPGFFDTAMLNRAPKKTMETHDNSLHFPMRLGRPPEFARLVRQIIANPMLNGANIRLDAGLRVTN